MNLISLLIYQAALWSTLTLAQTQSVNEPSFYETKVIKYDEKCKLLSERVVQQYKDIDQSNNVKVIKSKLAHIEKGTNLPDYLNKDMYTIISTNKASIKEEISELCSSIESNNLNKRSTEDEPAYEVRKLLDNGDSKNRIDVVFMGDGYTLSEKEKFFNDIQYLIDKLFAGVTFNSYFPIYNIWAMFVASKDSGITKGDEKKDTVFELYRPGEELRGIYYPDKTLDTVKFYCSKVGEFSCDYKVIIANDEFYGGIGGDVIISTSSKRSGSVVLNHEMGHTFADVGDEYDNSYAYYGANSDGVANITNIKWKHWLTNKHKLREEQSINRLLLYPWQTINQTNPFKVTFTSDGKFNKWFYRIGLSGVPEDNSVEITIDDKVIPWKSANTIDRIFYEFKNNDNGFTAGNHTLKITSELPVQPNNPKRLVNSVTLFEYKGEDEFNWNNNQNYAIYPTWDDHNIKRYRPTNEFCVMRNVTSNHFCNVCKESIWLQYLNRISLIDRLDINEVNKDVNKDIVKVSLVPLKFAQFRKDAINFKGEKYTVNWYKNNKLQKHLNNKFDIILNKKCKKNNWRVELKLTTPEVKMDPNNLLWAKKEFVI